MLKITVHETGEMVRLQLEGKLTAPWVTELERCWRDADPNKLILLDLSGVDYADAAGRYLLELMHAYGATLSSPTLPLQDAVLEISARPRSRLLSKFVGILVAMALLMPLEAQPLRLTLKRAVEIATSPEGSARIQLADEAVKQAKARADQARAALLPNLDATVGQTNQTRNLEALGIRIDSPVPGVNIPTFVGPFNTFDVRGAVTQSIFDFSAIRRYQSAKTSVGSLRSDRDNTGELVTAQVARSYLAALKGQADVETAQANVELAKAVLDLVESQKRAGTGTGIEVSRAGVQLANEQQRLLVARNGLRKAHLQLLRATGLRLDTNIELADTLAYVPVESLTWEQARERALEHRADLKAQLQREDAAKLSSIATKLERLPSVAGFADYGSIGTSVNNALPTRAFGVSLKLPLFDGGRRDARRAESQSQYRQERVRTHDLREQVELEIRLAIDSLASADEQVKVAAEGLKLAEDELASAKRRYQAGVATSIEVTDAQTRLERARDNYVAALFAHNVARIDLAVAQGTVEDVIR